MKQSKTASFPPNCLVYVFIHTIFLATICITDFILYTFNVFPFIWQ